jgi:hypothetical protein
MRAQRQAIARNVAEKLLAAEAALDVAAARIAELSASLPLARLDAKVSAIIGQDAIHSSASAMLAIAETREKIVATHTNLKHACDQIGIPEESYGDLIKPNKAAFRSDRPLLHAA